MKINFLKKIGKICIIILISMSLFYLFNNKVIVYNGILIEDGKEEPAIITYKNLNIKEIFNIGDGSLEVSTSENTYKYEFFSNAAKYKFFSNSTLSIKEDGINFSQIHRLSDKRLIQDGRLSFEFGTFYFDNKKENIIIDTELRRVYASEDLAFIEHIHSFSSFASFD